MNSPLNKADIPRLSCGDPEYCEANDFLIHEAELLDHRDFEGWLSLMAETVDYRMPVQTTRMGGEASLAAGNTHYLHDTAESLALRVKRLVSSHAAWCENPASRTRRFVSNVRVSRIGDNELEVKSYLLLVRNRLGNSDNEMLSAERTDRLLRHQGSLRLASRLIDVDQTCLGMTALSNFF